MTYTELEESFNKPLPKTVKLSVCETITDVPKFIKGHLAMVKTEKPIGKNYYDRLIKLKELL